MRGLLERRSGLGWKVLIGSSMILIFLSFASRLLEAQDDCALKTLIVGQGRGWPGEQVEVSIRGGVSCEVTGFVLAIGHVTSQLSFMGATPGAFLVAHAGEDLFFQVSGENDDGYAVVGAVFDLSFPITVLPTTITDGTVLATLRYQVSTQASPGVTPLLNRTETFGGTNPVSNIYSGRPGEPPIEPELTDGAVTILPCPFGSRA